MKAKHLEESDLKYIENNLELTASELARRLNKPRPRIAKVLKNLKQVSSLGTKPSIYDEHEVSYIIKNKDVMTYDEIALSLKKGTRSSVHRVILKHFPTHKKSTSRPWSDAQNALFIDNYYEKSNKELMAICGITESIIHYHATQLGLDPLKRNRTSIEHYTSLYLEHKGYDYKEQWVLGKYRYDFYIPCYKTLIEVNGDYWHSNPEVYKDASKLNDTQRSNLDRDRLKEKVAVENGFRLIYVWEKDIKDNILNLTDFFDKLIKLQESP